MKKTYLKPDAEYIKFYSEEEMTDPEINLSGKVDIGEGEGSDTWN